MKRNILSRIISSVKSCYNESEKYDQAVEGLRPTAAKLVAEKKAALKNFESDQEVDKILSL